jgi:manganese/iron transport system ATP-binding protein
MSTHPKPIDLSVSDITVSYSNGHTALYDVGFQLNAGTICALVASMGVGNPLFLSALWDLFGRPKGMF